MEQRIYDAYVKILHEELVPAMGCTEPIAVAYAAALARKTLGATPESVDISVSANIIKNVKSVVVPHTGGLRGIAAAAAAGIVAGDADAQLEVLSHVTDAQIAQMAAYMESTKFTVQPSYEHTTHTIDKNPGLYEVRYLDTQAYCIYAKRNGLILQLHYNTLEALEKVLSAHIQQYPSAWAKNIDCACEDVIQMFERLGFAEVTRQYEMARDL